MRLVPQRVQKKNVETLQLVERCLWNFAVVGEIRRGPKAIAVNFRVAMNQAHRFEGRPEKLPRAVDRTQFQLWQAAVLVTGVKDVTEHFAQKGGRIRTRIERQLPRLVTVAERAQIVDAQNMVGVRVGVENRIHVVDSFTDGLRVEIGRGIDEHHLARVLDHYRGTSAPVAWVAGPADRAIAAQSGHAHRSTTAQYGERGPHPRTFIL